MPSHLYLYLSGVSCPKSVVFYGLPYIRRTRYSEVRIGANCVFRSSAHSNLIGINRKCFISTLKSGAIIEIGKGSKFSGVVIGCAKSISIGEGTMVGANVLITDSDWHSEDMRSRGDNSISIGKKVWIGEGAKILKGVTIGDNSLVGAGCVVTKDIPADTIVVGNPCREVGSI